MNIGLDEKQIEIVCQNLNQLLADTSVLYQKTRKFHWYVTGTSDFRVFHALFEEIYSSLEKGIDDIAERVRALGEFPLATMREFLEYTSLTEGNDELSAEGMVNELLKDFESCISLIRNVLDEVGGTMDYGTDDMLASMIREHEKTAWMLRSSLS